MSEREKEFKFELILDKKRHRLQYTFNDDVCVCVLKNILLQ